MSKVHTVTETINTEKKNSTTELRRQVIGIDKPHTQTQRNKH